MEIHRNHSYAILTGDVVGSSKLDPSARRGLPATIRQAGAALRSILPQDVPFDIEVFRGDSWQLLVERPENSLLAALALRALLKSAEIVGGVDSRVSIGIGAITFVPGNRISEGDGPAFQASGRGLEEMDRRVRLDIRGADAEEAPGLRAVVWLIDACVRGWTPKQSRALVGTFSGWTQKQIGQRWKPKGISQQAVAQHLDRASWYAIEEGMEAYRTLVAGRIDSHENKS